MSYTKRGPFVDASPTGPYVDAAFFNNLEAALVGNASVAPAPTGVAATDTANLQAAFAAAATGYTDLILPTGTYVLNAALTWNLNRASLRCAGEVQLNFAALTSGVALTLIGNGGSNPDGSHRSIHHSVSGFEMIGPNTDVSTVDGILFTDTGIGNDQGALERVMVYGFRDGLTYGSNVWSLDHRKVYVSNCHRYGINLTMGTNAGECITYTGVTVAGCSNASGTAVAVYSPASGGADARFFGGSLDYNNIEGVFAGGAITFSGTHLEDNGTGPMFQYSCSSGGAATSVTFRDCDWDSSTGGVRDHLHEITASTSSKITVVFDGDKGGVYPNTYSTWLLDNSGQIDANVTSTVRSFAVDSTNGTGLLLGDYYNLLTNGYFEDSTSFVAAPGVGGWTSGTGTWTIGAGGKSGNGLTVTAGTALSATTSQRIPLGASRQPVRFGGAMRISAYTSGNIQMAVQFYAADGTTAVLGQIRVQSTLAAASTSWTQYFRRFVPPKSAAYMTVQLSTVSFVGTAIFDSIEVVPI